MDLRVWLLAPVGVILALMIGGSSPVLAGLIVLVGIFVPFAYTYFALVGKAAGKPTATGRPLEEEVENEAEQS